MWIIFLFVNCFNLEKNKYIKYYYYKIDLFQKNKKVQWYAIKNRFFDLVSDFHFYITIHSYGNTTSLVNLIPGLGHAGTKKVHSIYGTACFVYIKDKIL